MLSLLHYWDNPYYCQIWPFSCAQRWKSVDQKKKKNPHSPFTLEHLKGEKVLQGLQIVKFSFSVLFFSFRRCLSTMDEEWEERVKATFDEDLSLDAKSNVCYVLIRIERMDLLLACLVLLTLWCYLSAVLC